MAGPSKSQVNKAGKLIRRRARGERIDDMQYRVALATLREFRSEFRGPLIKATMGLRSVVGTEGCEIRVSQRLKRTPTVVDKLVREPTMQLGNMHDIAGCRAVLGSLNEVRRVQRRLSKNRPPLRTFDYIENPKPSGYRGIHVVVQYDDRPVEVQLRTVGMHEWAMTVEQLGVRLQVELKSGKGPKPVLDLLRDRSRLQALEEAGEAVDWSQLDTLRQQATPFIGGDQR